MGSEVSGLRTVAAVAFGSVNGHGHQDGLRLVRVLRARPVPAAPPSGPAPQLGTDGLRNVGQGAPAARGVRRPGSSTTET
ncbi:hypothetical protein STENM327S_00353 [Streptomyces tendae]